MRLEIENLHFEAILGILKKERETPQKIVVNCSFEYKYLKDSYIDYAKVAAHIQESIQKEKFLLIEDALEFLLQSIKENFTLITYLKLKISKPEILANCTVSAQVEKNY